MEKEFFNLSHKPLFCKVFKNEKNAKLLLNKYYDDNSNNIKFIKEINNQDYNGILLLVDGKLTILSVDKINDIVIISKTIVDKNFNELQKQLVFI